LFIQVIVSLKKHIQRQQRIFPNEQAKNLNFSHLIFWDRWRTGRSVNVFPVLDNVGEMMALGHTEVRYLKMYL